MNPFYPFTDPDTLTPQFFLWVFVAGIVCGIALVWPIARWRYLRRGKREGLGMIRRCHMPENL